MKKNPATLPLVAAGLVLAGAGIIITQIYFATLGELTNQKVQVQSAEVEPLKIAPDQFGPAQTQSSFELGETIAKLYVPRFGNSYVRNIAEGTDLEKVLNRVGIGRYIGTQMPGEKGNFAIAGHRTGAGGPMRDIDKFAPGDKVYVETEDTWYTYLYLESKIVDPGAIGTIAPDPEGLTNKVANQKYLTMTSCTPVYVNTERIIAWFALIEQQPSVVGMPEELAKTYQK